MNELNDTRRAWRFVDGFDMPALTDAKRSEWSTLIASLSVVEFQVACRAARSRPVDALRWRPSVEEMRGYVTAGTARPSKTAVPEWRGHGYEVPTESGRAHGMAYIAKIRAAQGWVAKTPTHDHNRVGA